MTTILSPGDAASTAAWIDSPGLTLIEPAWAAPGTHTTAAARNVNVRTLERAVLMGSPPKAPTARGFFLQGEAARTALRRRTRQNRVGSAKLFLGCRRGPCRAGAGARYW